MKYVFLLFLFLLLSAATCERNEVSQAALFDKTWLHSTEEDQPEYKVYRPNTFNFPPSRGRTGFSLDKDGVFHLFTIAPTDGLEEHRGSWKKVKNNLLRVSFEEKQAENFDLEVVSVSNDMLKIRRSLSKQ